MTEPQPHPVIHTAECQKAMYRGPRVCICGAAQRRAEPQPTTRNAAGVEFVTASCDRCGFQHAHRAEQEEPQPTSSKGRVGSEPRTEAGRRLWDFAHGVTRLDKPETRDKARDLIREEVVRVEQEAAALLPEPLDVERLRHSLPNDIWDHDGYGGNPDQLAEEIAAEYARLSEPKP